MEMAGYVQSGLSGKQQNSSLRPDLLLQLWQIGLLHVLLH
jgi:hypothetical protein